MASTTALTMVNRLLRRHGFEDYTAFTAPETLLALDLVNQAIQDLTAVRDYPWLVRYTNELRLFAPRSGTSGATVAANGMQVTITAAGGYTGTETDYNGGSNAGELRAHFLLTGASSHSTTAMRAVVLEESGGNLLVTLATSWPGGAQSNVAWKFIFNDYLLPDNMAKVLSVRHQDRPLRLLEVDNTDFEESLPRPTDIEGDPEIVLVGGIATATYVSGTTPAERVRLMVWPTPTTDTWLTLTTKRRIAPLTATTSTLIAPEEFTFDVVDRAEALSNMTQRFNAPDLAAQQMRASLTNAERKWANSVVDPNRRHSLRAHDSGSRRRDPTRYKDITGL